MYRLIRTIHLYTGLGLGFAIALYACTGFVILHGDWLPNGESERKITIEKYDAPAAGSTEEQALVLANELVATHHLSGRPQRPLHWDDGTWFFSYQRPGTVEELRIKAGQPILFREYCQ
jgi:hypothetical protein